MKLAKTRVITSKRSSSQSRRAKPTKPEPLKQPAQPYRGRQRNLESSFTESPLPSRSNFSSRSSSIATVASVETVHEEGSVALIGWSYQRTVEGDYIITSKDQFKDRYMNPRVEEELVEFKQEIDKKFKESSL